MPSIRFSRTVLTVGAALLVASTPAWPQTDADVVEAREHYERARQLHNAEHYEEAAAEYIRAFELSGKPLLLFNTAQVWRLAGRWELAVQRYREYLELDPTGPGADVARQYVEILQRALSKEESSERRIARATLLDTEAKRAARKRAEAEARKEFERKRREAIQAGRADAAASVAVPTEEELRRGLPGPGNPLAPRLGATAGAMLIPVVGVVAGTSSELRLHRLSVPISMFGEVQERISLEREYRTLASELGAVIALPPDGSGATLGFGDIEVSGQVSAVALEGDANHWRLQERTPNTAWVSSIAARVGLVRGPAALSGGARVSQIPIAGLSTLTGHVSVGVPARVRNTRLPGVAVRFAVTETVGSADLSLSARALDVAVSHSFATAYQLIVRGELGWQWLAIRPSSGTLDGTPDVSPAQDPTDFRNNFQFREHADITRQRAFATIAIDRKGAFVSVRIASANAGASINDRSDANNLCEPNEDTTMCDAPDTAASQMSFTLAVGARY